jgi:hypothetical protein
MDAAVARQSHRITSHKSLGHIRASAAALPPHFSIVALRRIDPTLGRISYSRQSHPQRPLSRANAGLISSRIFCWFTKQ